MEQPNKLVDENNLSCLLCKINFKKKHDFQVHVKGSNHNSALLALEEKKSLVEQRKEKERKKEEFKCKWFHKVVSDVLLWLYVCCLLCTDVLMLCLLIV